MIPYYQDSAVTIYHGDTLRILPILGWVQAIISDPVWPNAHPGLVGSNDPWTLFDKIVARLPKALSFHVWLGCQSDPRFLSCIPKAWKFLRSSQLSLAVPSYNGRCLVTGDVLYSFGEWPTSKTGARVIPGECRVTCKPKCKEPHPCARNLEHAKWVIKWWTNEGDTILDPTCGVGTILRAAKDLGRKAIGIEIEERHCSRAADRMAQEVFAL